MKFNLLLFVSFLMLTFVSCDNDYPNDGYFKVGEKTYYLNDASLESVGYENGYHQLRLTLDNSNGNEPHAINFLFYS